MSILQKTILLAIALVIVVVAVYKSLVADPSKRKLLLKEGRYTVCTVTAYVKRKSTQYPVYEYSVNGVTYQSSGNGILQQQEEYFFSNSVGKRYFLIYLPNNPTEHSILPYCRTPDSINAPANGWDSLPVGKLRFLVP